MGRRRQKSKLAKRNRLATKDEPDELKNAPHSFVVHKGEVGRGIKSLVKDMRKVMEPFTAAHLKVQRKSAVKDYVSVAGLMHVTHLLMFTHTQVGPYLKIGRMPRGPTLTFRVKDYTLTRDVLSSLKRQVTHDKQFLHHPLVIMNNLGGEEVQLKLMAATFQNMFPSINVNKVQLRDVRRCVLLNYNPDDGTLDLRHYTIRVVPVGASKGVKRLVQNRVPNLSKFQDIADFVTKSGMLSDSEVEDDPASHVTLPQKVASRGNIPFHQSSVRLVELGPRLTLQLIKVEERLMEGEILFHEHVTKTEEEKKAIKKKIDSKLRQKVQRKQIQEQNLRRKEEAKEELKKKSLEGMKRKRAMDQGMAAGFEVEGEDGEADDDVEWYRKEVGQEPEKDLFSGPSQKRQKVAPSKWKKKPQSNQGWREKDRFEEKEEQKKNKGPNKAIAKLSRKLKVPLKGMKHLGRKGQQSSFRKGGAHGKMKGKGPRGSKGSKGKATKGRRK